MPVAELEIHDESLANLEGKIIVVTGSSSGIGLATVKFLLEIGCHIIAGDLNPIPIEHERLTFQTTNVTSWADLSALFTLAKHKHHRVDHVFANAGITSRTDYLDEHFDASGSLLEPSHIVIDVNLKSVVNTTHLAIHYMRHQEPSGGSIVLTASASSFQRFRAADYTVAKHGVLGLMRALQPILATPQLPIRINSIAPSWTNTGIVPTDAVKQIAGVGVQEPVVVARSVALLFADGERHGQLMYSVDGRYSEIEGVLLGAAKEVVGEVNEDVVVAKLLAVRDLFAAGGDTPNAG